MHAPTGRIDLSTPDTNPKDGVLLPEQVGAAPPALLIWMSKLLSRKAGETMIKYLITLTAAAAVLVGCEQRNVEKASKDFNQLPAAVQKTVRAQAPDAEIADIDQKTRDGVTVYKIQFRDKDR